MVAVTDIIKKKGKEKITALTAYDYTFARLIDGLVDIVLVGDSCGMVVAGYENTLPVSMEQMLYHVQAVKRGIKKSLLVADMPFLSYQGSVEEAIKNAGRFLKAGAQAVKIEGGEEVCEIVHRMVSFGIPVMGHIGLTPQYIHKFGGYRVQGKTAQTAVKLYKSAVGLQRAGVFSIVLESIPEQLASFITEKLEIPTIGIGAGRGCDGQILVLYDLLGLFPDFTPRFAKKYINGAEIVKKAVAQYVEDVKNKTFPSEEHSFFMSPEEFEGFLNLVKGGDKP